MRPPDYTLSLDQLPDPLPIAPLSRAFDAEIIPPGSKSLTNRAYIVAALADGASVVRRPLRADDTDRLLDALCTLGADADWTGDDVRIRGVGGRFPRGGIVNLGDGGTPTRFMLAAACLAREPVTVDGSPRMRERPVSEGVDMLRTLGAKIEYVEADGRLPVRTLPSDSFRGGTVTVAPQKSSQFASAVLLVAPHLADGLDLHLEPPVTSRSYLLMTSAFLTQVGIEITPSSSPDDGPVDDYRVEPQPVTAFDYAVEPDASSATYWLGAAAVAPPESVIRIPGLRWLSPQPDKGLVVPLGLMGATWAPVRPADENTTSLGAGTLEGIDYDMDFMPDAALTLATVCAMAEGRSYITGLHTLPTKESDRIGALATELRRIGCTVEATADSITIDPSTRHDDPVTIETYNDHRVAMAFAVLGLARPGISIANPGCVAKSYPGFWAHLARLYA